MTEPLRTALLELGDVPPPPDLADAALARARRDRRRRATGLVAGVAILAAAAIAVPTLAVRRAPAEPATPRQSHVIVAGYSLMPDGGASMDPTGRIETLDPKTGQATDPSKAYRVYDPSSGRYVAPPWDVAIPSPDGRFVAVSFLQRPTLRKVGIVAADRILDRSAVRWVADNLPDTPLPRGFGPGTWSPDGDRLYLARPADREDIDFSRAIVPVLVVDPRTGTSRSVTLSRPAPPSRTNGSLVFGPRGSGFAIASWVLDLKTSPKEGNLALFDERGRITGTSPIGPGEVPDQPFSPEGRFVVANLFTGDGTARVLRVDTGTEVGRVEGRALGWADDEHYLVWNGSSVRVIDLGSGRVVAQVRLSSPGSRPYRIWFARVDGPVPPGAVVVT